MSEARITAVIVAYESAEVLPDCLQALADEGIGVIVVDNASSDETARIASEAGAHVILNARNEGFGRGMNIGAMAAEGIDYLLLLNPDTLVRRGFRQAMLVAATGYPDAGLIGPRIIGPEGDVFFPTRSLLSPYLQNERRQRWTPEGDCCAPFLSGACLLVRRDLFLRLGGFDPNIFLFYEDNDLCRRVIDAGQSIVYAHEAIVSHAQGKSSRRAKGRIYKARWHYAWSEGYIARKYRLKSPSMATFIRNGLKYCGALLTGSRDKAERYGGAAAGALAALRGRSALGREGLS